MLADDPPAESRDLQAQIQSADRTLLDLHRRVGSARRRQFVRIAPLRGRGAKYTYFASRLVARIRHVDIGPAAADPPVSPPSTVENSRDLEHRLGAVRGEIVVVEAELRRAEQDLAVPWFRAVAAATRTPRAELVGRIRSVTARRRRPAAPRVSILTAAYETPPELLRKCLGSVARQTLSDLEHVIVDDGSASQDVRDVLTKAVRRDRRRVVQHRAVNGGIVAASADALAAARGEIVLLLDHDDVLAPNAVAAMVAALDATPTAVLAYSDHDTLTADGRCIDPQYKPDFSPERLRNQNYVTHLMAFRRQTALTVGGFRAGFDGAQDHDLALRLSEAGDVVHVPEVLYHWRQAPGSVAADPLSKPYAYEAGRAAVDDHCRRTGIDAVVEHGALAGCYRVRRNVADPPLVSVVVPTRGTSSTVWGVERVHVVASLESLDERATYPRLEYVVVADRATPAAVIAELERRFADRLRLVWFDGDFNFSAKCNLGADRATGGVLLFLNDDTELVAPGSLEVLVGHLRSPDVGLVGAKLLFADGRVQHAGHVFADQADHALFGWPGHSPGPARMLAVERECSGVTAAAVAVRRDTFDAVGCFDPAFPGNFNDVDLSLRVRDRGLRIVWTPFACWYHFESITRVAAPTDAEVALVTERWLPAFRRDPYYNPNLSPLRNDWVPRPLRSGLPPDTFVRRRTS